MSVLALAVPEEVLVVEVHLSGLGALILAPYDVGTHVFGFALCDAAVDGDVKLGAGLIAVDALLLEVYIHAQLIEQADIFQAVHRVPRESGNGFRDDHIDLALLAATDHTVEFVTLFHACSRNALVGEYTHK